MSLQPQTAPVFFPKCNIVQYLTSHHPWCSLRGAGAAAAPAPPAPGYVPGTHSVVFVTCLNEHIARDIARAIMDRRLAACVNILIPTWHKGAAGALKCGRAGQGWGGFLTALLLRACFHFRSIHPFEIPDIISLPIEQGNPAYLRWMEENVPRPIPITTYIHSRTESLTSF
uniref:Uncharacterized protein n=1 Tax=Zonotrichia albicollis TaxID=44394 RepID=A0A8D2M8J4_ZONAL